MSPEQARGAIDELGPGQRRLQPGCDALRAAHGPGCLLRGTSRLEVIDRVVHGRFPAAAGGRSLHAGPARSDLPEGDGQRARASATTSVRELAQDLEHWLADEPVSAYPERRLERLGRWLRQHRTWTYAVAARPDRHRPGRDHRASGRRCARRRESRSARRPRPISHGPTGRRDYLTSVSENTLLKEQDSVDIRGLRAELLARCPQVLPEVRQPAQRRPALRRQLAKAYSRVGEIARRDRHDRRGDRGLQVCPGDLGKVGRGCSRRRRGPGTLGRVPPRTREAQRKSGDRPAAAQSLETARTVFGKLVQSHPASAPHLTILVTCYVEIGKVQGNLQHFKQGIAALEKAKSVQQQLISKSPDEPGPEQRMAEIINVMGYVYNRGGDDAAALLAFEQVKQICKSLLDRVTAGPKPVSLLDLEALAHYNIGTIYLRQKETKQALGSFEQSLACQSALVAAHPSVTKFQEKLGLSHAEIADLLYKAGHPDEAMVAIRKSIPILETLVRSDPDTAIYHADLGRSVNTLGYFLDEAGNNREASGIREGCRAAATRRCRLARRSRLQAVSGQRVENLGEQYVDFNRVKEGLPYYEDAIRLRRDVSASHPDKRGYVRELVFALNALGKLQRRAGNPTGALRVVERQRVRSWSRSHSTIPISSAGSPRSRPRPQLFWRTRTSFQRPWSCSSRRRIACDPLPSPRRPTERCANGTPSHSGSSAHPARSQASCRRRQDRRRTTGVMEGPAGARACRSRAQANQRPGRPDRLWQGPFAPRGRASPPASTSTRPPPTSRWRSCWDSPTSSRCAQNATPPSCLIAMR